MINHLRRLRAAASDLIKVDHVKQEQRVADRRFVDMACELWTDMVDSIELAQGLCMELGDRSQSRKTRSLQQQLLASISRMRAAYELEEGRHR